MRRRALMGTIDSSSKEYFPEGYFPIYLTTEDSEFDGFERTHYIYPTEQTIDLYNRLRDLCIKEGEHNGYEYYIADFTIYGVKIYIDNYESQQQCGYAEYGEVWIDINHGYSSLYITKDGLIYYTTFN